MPYMLTLDCSFEGGSHVESRTVGCRILAEQDKLHGKEREREGEGI